MYLFKGTAHPKGKSHTSFEKNEGDYMMTDYLGGNYPLTFEPHCLCEADVCVCLYNLSG